MNDRYRIYRATGADYRELADVAYQAVREGPSPYTDAQRARWMPRRSEGGAWTTRLDEQMVAAGRDAHGIAGFMTLAGDGYIDLAHIRPRARGTGLFRLLFGWIEAASRGRGDPALRVHASLTAEPAFAAMGFEVVERETIAIGDERLDRALMRKDLAAGPCSGAPRSTW